MRRLWLLVVVVTALTAVGGVFTVRLLAQEGHHGPEASNAVREARTSFGRLNVQQVEVLPGLSAKDLAGVTHGFEFVGAGALQVQVSVLLRNETGRRLAVDPRRFRLRTGRESVPLTNSTIRRGVLEAGAATQATLAFVAPRSAAGTPLRLEFGGAQIDLGRAGVGLRAAGTTTSTSPGGREARDQENAAANETPPVRGILPPRHHRAPRRRRRGTSVVSLLLRESVLLTSSTVRCRVLEAGAATQATL